MNINDGDECLFSGVHIDIISFYLKSEFTVPPFKIALAEIF